MAEDKGDGRKPWSPRIESAPLFINSADYERQLGEADDPPEDTADESQGGGGEETSADGSAPVVKPAG